MIRTLALLLAVMCGPANAAAPMRFERLGSDEGLSQQAVLAIGQDTLGFMWLGTEDGLNRFDGFAIQHSTESEGLFDRLISPFIFDLK